MVRGEDNEEPQQDAAEVVDFGSTRPVRPRWLSTLLLAAMVAAAVVALTLHAGKRPPPAPAAPPAPSQRLTPPAPAGLASLPPVSLPKPALIVTYLGHRLLGVTAGWDVFGLAPDDVVAIQLSRGEITRTVLPPAEGSGPVSFLVGPHQAIVRPLDNVPGYLVPDGAFASRLTGTLAAGELLLPGPVPGEEWLVTGNASTLPLLGPGGRPTGARITLPAGLPAQSAMPDGRGDLLVFGQSGRQYDAGPHWIRPVGALLVAIGRTRWLSLACRQGRCRNLVIDVATGARRVLPGPALPVVTWPWPWQPGVVAPDGSAAAVIVAGHDDQDRLDLISLSTGASAAIAVSLPPQASSQTLAWSPDSNWLFVLNAHGKLLAVNARSHQVASLGVRLPPLSQLAIRGA